MRKKARRAKSGDQPKPAPKPKPVTMREHILQELGKFPKVPDPDLGGLYLPLPGDWKGSSDDWKKLEELGGRPHKQGFFNLPAAAAIKLWPERVVPEEEEPERKPSNDGREEAERESPRK